MRIVFFEPTARRVHTKETNQEPISGSGYYPPKKNNRGHCPHPEKEIGKETGLNRAAFGRKTLNRGGGSKRNSVRFANSITAFHFYCLLPL